MPGPPEPDPYRELFERSTDAILIIEGETFVDCNQATVDMLRYSSREELLRTHPSELSPPTQPDGRDSFEKANEMIATAFARGSHRFVWDHQRADGEVFPVEVLLTPMQRGGRRILHVVWRDITERKRLEEQLRQTQKMEAIGRLAGGVAHDFNNLLVAIIGNADLVDECLEDESLREPVREILRAGERAATLVRQLLAFSRKQEHAPVVIDLNDILVDMHKLLQRIIGEHLNLIVRPAERPMLIKADPSQLELVVINLATNARDAMADGGTVAVEVQQVTVDEGGDPASLEPLEAGEYVVLSVRDDGEGMDAATMTRMFDPFFTTKEVGKGTGLGLATVFGIAKQNGGTVGVVSSPGSGTTMKVFFPISLQRPETVDPTPEPAKNIGGTETILVAEDEAAVSALVASALRARGYRVILAENGREALALWERYRTKVDLVLSDVIMPVMSGPEMIRRLREGGHHPRVLFISGYTGTALSALDDLSGEVDLLEKPFSARELVGRVRAALDRDRDGSG